MILVQSHSGRHRNMMIFLLSQGITLFGSQIVQLAIVWYVTKCTSSGVWIAAFSLSSYLPQFLLSFLGGELADRYPEKVLIIDADLFIAAATLAMFLVIPHISADRDLMWALFALSILRSFGAGIQVPAVNAMTARLVQPEEYTKYNGINSTIQSVVQFAAPALAVTLLTICSLRVTLAIDAVTALLGIGMLLAVELKQEVNKNRECSALQEVKEGIKYACSCDIVRKTLSIYGLFLFLSVPAGYLSGLYVSGEYGQSYWYLTYVELAGFGGMVLGGILMSNWSESKQINEALIIGLVVFGSMSMVMAVCCSFRMYLVCMTIYGVAMTMIQVAITTRLQGTVETKMHGRIFGLMSSIYASCYPVGMALFGVMADRISLKLLMIASGMGLVMKSVYEFVNNCRLSIVGR